jgi:hypothetical protein
LFLVFCIYDLALDNFNFSAALSKSEKLRALEFASNQRVIRELRSREVLQSYNSRLNAVVFYSSVVLVARFIGYRFLHLADQPSSLDVINSLSISTSSFIGSERSIFSFEGIRIEKIADPLPEIIPINEFVSLLVDLELVSFKKYMYTSSQLRLLILVFSFMTNFKNNKPQGFHLVDSRMQNTFDIFNVLICILLCFLSIDFLFNLTGSLDMLALGVVNSGLLVLLLSYLLSRMMEALNKLFLSSLDYFFDRSTKLLRALGFKNLKEKEKALEIVLEKKSELKDLTFHFPEDNELFLLLFWFLSFLVLIWYGVKEYQGMTNPSSYQIDKLVVDLLGFYFLFLIPVSGHMYYAVEYLYVHRIYILTKIRNIFLTIGITTLVVLSNPPLFYWLMEMWLKLFN